MYLNKKNRLFLIFGNFDCKCRFAVSSVKLIWIDGLLSYTKDGELYVRVYVAHLEDKIVQTLNP